MTAAQPASAGVVRTGAHQSAPVLLVGLLSDVLPGIIGALQALGRQVYIGRPADIYRRSWSLVVSAPVVPGLGPLELLAALSQASASATSLLVVGADAELATLRGRPGIGLLPYPFTTDELVQALETLRAGPAQPPDATQPELNQLWSASGFADRIDEEIEAGRATGEPRPMTVASVRLHELRSFLPHLQVRTVQSIFQEQIDLARADQRSPEVYGRGGNDELLILIPDLNAKACHSRLNALSYRMAGHAFRAEGQQTRFTPAIGYALAGPGDTASHLIAKARAASAEAAADLDLQPKPWSARPKRREPSSSRLVRLVAKLDRRGRVWVQYVITMLLGVGLPFAIYRLLDTAGHDISQVMYLVVVALLTFTTLSIWIEGVLAMRPKHPPVEPASAYPPASAIIAAYLPNEAPIIEDTIRAFLQVQYPAPLQVILAYNTPRDMDIEARLREIAAEHPNFVPMRVQGSTSKAQNVNAALAHATGEFTAVFDADHQPDPDSFRRAWRWISHGADVVQGHCLIRNGDASWVARMIAIEFEQIYSVNHPGRAALHGFGIFGGSNGYWRTPLLRGLRMHGFMLTEDIDSSMRAVISGRQIVSDPFLVSRELAPETMPALVKQRLRWAQGWLQVSMKWILPALRSPRLNLQQKLGMFQLLVMREAFPWISLQIIPLIAFWAIRAGSLWNLDWLVPIFVVTTLFTLSTGPGQILFTYRLAEQQIKQRKPWFWFYLLASTVFYSGQKNALNRIAHIKEVFGETTWNVTPRVSAPKKT